jgi:hypothetical protein
MRSRNVVVASVVAVLVATALFGSVAYGIYVGINQQHTPGATRGAIVTGVVPLAVTSGNSAPVNGSASSSSAIAQPAPGAFLPGGPPYGESGVGADGISAWGVAYREVGDPNAQPDTALVKAAYQDAEKKVTDLGTATGVKVGKLVALSDHGTNQPFFKPCIQVQPPLGKPVPGAPVPQPGATGSGTTGSGTAIQPAPVAPCAANNNSYLVVWVFIRHAIG